MQLKTVVPTRAKNRVMISHSELGSMECWHRHHLQYELGYMHKDKGEYLQYGTIWDTFLNAYYDSKWNVRTDSDATTADPMERIYDSVSIADKKMRGIINAVEAKGYIPDDWESRCAEFRQLLLGMAFHFHAQFAGDYHIESVARQQWFEVPLRTPQGKRSKKFWMHGAIDGIVRIDGQIYIWEDKVTKGLSVSYKEGMMASDQLKRYGWALRECGIPVAGYIINASLRGLPSSVDMQAREAPVLDADGEPMTEPIPCPHCDGTGFEHHNLSSACVKCYGAKTQLFASGARKGEPKTRKVTRPALRNMVRADGAWTYTTTPAIFAEAITRNGLDADHYQNEWRRLTSAYQDRNDTPFHWRETVTFNDAELDLAGEQLYQFAKLKGNLPALKMGSTMKCRMCSVRMICAEPTGENFANFTSRNERRLAALSETAPVLPAPEPGPVPPPDDSFPPVPQPAAPADDYLPF